MTTSTSTGKPDEVFSFCEHPACLNTPAATCTICDQDLCAHHLWATADGAPYCDACRPDRHNFEDAAVRLERLQRQTEPNDDQDTLTDLLLDLLHICDARGLSFVGALRSARHHHRQERNMVPYHVWEALRVKAE